MTSPSSSLLVPCHNSAGHLPRLWETVRAQTLPFDEIICYDDASTDRTAEVAQALGARVIRGETNGGPAHARNQLWRAARGEWVHFHDSDDLLEPAYHAKVAARAAGALDVVLCNARWVREDTRELEMEWRYSEAELQADPAPYLLSHPVGGINGYYRRSVLAAIGGFDEQLKVWEDADLHVRLAVHGARIGVVEESLVIALRRGDSLSAEMRRNWRNRLRALQHYAKVLPAGCRPALIAEIENATRSLVLVGETAAAREGIALSRSLGGNPPSTRHPLLLVCKRVLGPLAAFRLQALARRK
jgi:glycosyltransferase involved in cell wall biosynthesis